MHVKNAKKTSSKLQIMQTALSRNCCLINVPILSAVIHYLQRMTAKIALNLQWDFGHSGNLQNLLGNCLQCNFEFRLSLIYDLTTLIGKQSYYKKGCSSCLWIVKTQQVCYTVGQLDSNLVQIELRANYKWV